ncbi:MAG: NAD(P)H-dependent oxidoreductase [Steroidobacteraceae bacterium]
MKHLVVVAHPAAHSFTLALARTYAAELERLGHSQRTYDLYRMEFNPVLTAQELLPVTVDHSASPDVLIAQDDIRAADALTVIYPLWWMSMPAMMKGFVDRVFARGFAYEAHDGIVRGLLSGKQAVLITISGAPLPQLVKSGGWNAVQVLQDTHVLRSTGFELLEHLHFDEIVPNISNVVAEQCMARVRDCARKNFSLGREVATK